MVPDSAQRTRPQHRITYNIQYVINIPRNQGKISGSRFGHDRARPGSSQASTIGCHPHRYRWDRPGDNDEDGAVHLSSLTLLSASFGSTSLRTPMKSRSASARARSQSIGTGLDGSDRLK